MALKYGQYAKRAKRGCASPPENNLSEMCTASLDKAARPTPPAVSASSQSRSLFALTLSSPMTSGTLQAEAIFLATFIVAASSA
uniref:Uncharacterized protein n=1 Tax=Steinernema glaseri TaxID=37863 RepID=A0A1I8ASB8_9BILA